MKIRPALHHYQELLTQYSKSDSTAGLRTAVTDLLRLLPKVKYDYEAKGTDYRDAATIQVQGLLVTFFSVEDY